MEELTLNVNWLAVIVGFVVSFALGWLWYSPALFQKKWAAGVGLSSDRPDFMPKMAMIMQALGTFLLSWLVGVTAANEALLTILLVVFTIIILQVAGGLYTQKSSAAIGVEAGFVAAMAVVMIIIQGIF